MLIHRTAVAVSVLLMCGTFSVPARAAISQFALPTTGAEPTAIAAGPDGNLWFTEFAGNQIGRMTPAGGLTVYPLTAGNSGPRGMTAGPDGNLWFTERTANQIGRITPPGTIAEVAVPAPGRAPERST